VLDQVSNSLSWALQDTADVIARSADHFNRAYRAGEDTPPAEPSATPRPAGKGASTSAPPSGT
jgi:hypothetical protein